MADFVIDAGLKLDATAALNNVKQIGKYIDDAFGKQSKLNIDTAPAEKDIKGLGKLAEKTFTDIGQDAAKSAEASTTALKSQLGRLISLGQGGSDAARAIREELKLAAAAAKKLDDEVGGVEVALGGASKSASGLLGGLKKSFAEGQAQAASGGGIFGSLASGIGQLASPVGLATAALGTFTAAAASAFTEYRELDKNIQNIGTLGVEASGLSLNKFEGLINDLSTRVPDAASNIANGVYNAISAGITGSEETIVGFAEIASKVGVAGLSDTNTAVNALTSVVNAYGTGAAGAKETSDVFFATIKAGKTTFAELNQGLAQVIPAASAAGISFQEVGASVAKLTTVGIPTAQATTQIRQAIIELQKPSKPLADALAKIGLNAANMGAELKKPASEGGGLINVLQKLEQSATKSGKSMIQIFSSAEAASAALSLTGKNAESTNAIVAGIGADVAGGVAEKAYQSAAQGIDVQLGIIKNKVQAVFNDIFGTLKPIVERAFSTILEVFGKIKDSLAPVFEKVSTTLGQAFSRIGTVLKPIIAVIGGLISVGLVYTFTVLGNVVNTVFDIFIKVFDGIAEALKPLIDSFKKAFNITDDVTKTFDPLETLQKIFESITTTINDYFAIVGAVATFLVTVFVEALKAVVNVAVFLYDAYVLVTSGFGLFKSEVKEAGKETEKAGGFFTSLMNIIKNAPAIINALTAGFKAFTGAIGDLITDFSFDKLKDLITGKTVTDAFNSSINTENAKRAADAQVKLFEDKIKELAKLEGEAFNKEKVRLLEAVQTKKAILGEQNAIELRNKINAINLATKAETKAEITAAAAADEEKKSKLNDLSKEIIKVEQENAKLISISRKNASTDENEKERIANKEKTDLAISAIEEQIKEVSEREKVSNEQKALLIQQLRRKIALTTEAGYDELLALEVKFGQKQIANDKQIAADRLKEKIEQQKRDIELTKALAENATDAQIKASLTTKLGAQKAELIALEAEQEKTALEAKNKILIEAEAKLIKAKADQKIAIQRAEDERAHNATITSLGGATIGAGNGFGVSDATSQLLDETSAQVAIMQKLFEEVQKQVATSDAAILALNLRTEQEKTNALRAATKERREIERQAAKDSQGFWSDVANSFSGFLTDLNGSLIDSYDKVEQERKAAQQQGATDAKNEYDKESKELKSQLLKREITWEQYQEKILKLNEGLKSKMNTAGVAFGKAFSDGVQKSLKNLSDNFTKSANEMISKWTATAGEFGDVDAQLAEKRKQIGKGTVEEQAQTVSDIAALEETRNKEAESSTAITKKIYTDMAGSLAVAFGQSIVEGKKNLGDYVVLALNALEALIPVFSAQILGITLATEGPVGLLTWAGLTAALTVAVEAAKAAVSGGFYEGGYTGNKGKRETAGVVHGQEYVISANGVRGQVREFDELHNILKGGTNLGAILHAYKYPELSNLSVGANGKLHSNTFTIAPIQYQTNNNSNIISELQNQTNHLSRKLDTVISAQREMPNAFRGKMNVGLEVYHDDTISTKKQALTIKRKALQ